MKKAFIVTIIVGWLISLIGFWGLAITWLAALAPYIKELLHKIRCYLRRKADAPE